jgi:hypothetical protein
MAKNSMYVVTDASGKVIAGANSDANSNQTKIQVGFVPLPGQSLFRLDEVPEHIRKATKANDILHHLNVHFNSAGTKDKFVKI